MSKVNNAEDVLITPDGEFRASEDEEEYQRQVKKWGVDWKYRSSAYVAQAVKPNDETE